MHPFSLYLAISTTHHMAEPLIHTDLTSVPNSPLELLFHSIAGLVHEKETEKQQLHERCVYLEQQIQNLPQTCIVAEGKQKKLLAILNAIYEGGYIAGCNKKEFMQRMATAVTARMHDLSQISRDQAAFKAQYATGYKTMRSYLWSLEAEKYDEAQG